MPECTISEILRDKTINIPEGMRATALHWLEVLNDTFGKYEELRKLIDGGSESMTHADAVEDLRAIMEEQGVLYPKKPLKYFNGRIPDSFGRRSHGYICAHSIAEAVRLGKQCLFEGFNRTELTKYWSPCWGMAADSALGPQTKPGVFVQIERRFYRFSGRGSS